VIEELTPRLLDLARLAKDNDLQFTVDAEEADRLELSLEIVGAVLRDPSLRGFDGFGLAVQAYQKRAPDVIDWIEASAAALNRRVPSLAHLTILIAVSEISDLPCQWSYRRDLINTVTAGPSAADAAKVRVFRLVTPPATTPPVYGTHTYVHAKMWIFDDELAVIGSANCNRRGWQSDSEANAFIFDDAARRG